MKKSIPLTPAPDFSSLVPPDLAGNAPSPTSSGLSMDNLSPEEANAIPDEGTANVKFKVHHRSSKTDIGKDGDRSERHHVRMHVHEFEPHPPEVKPKKKKLLESTDAAQAAGDGLGGLGGGPPDMSGDVGTPDGAP
jgi:hypothetical protein